MKPNIYDIVEKQIKFLLNKNYPCSKDYYYCQCGHRKLCIKRCDEVLCIIDFTDYKDCEIISLSENWKEYLSSRLSELNKNDNDIYLKNDSRQKVIQSFSFINADKKCKKSKSKSCSSSSSKSSSCSTKSSSCSSSSSKSSSCSSIKKCKRVRRGPRGFRGFKGSPGCPGEPGLRGRPGIPGCPGQRGRTGPRGSTGPQGLQGIKGDTGQQGSMGYQGLRGDTGATGMQGLKGDKGEQGDEGVQGVTGATGIQGIQGDKGDTGFTGDTGSTGIQGIQGVQGIQGDTGPTGDTGFTGPTGIKGDTGADGLFPLAPGDGYWIWFQNNNIGSWYPFKQQYMSCSEECYLTINTLSNSVGSYYIPQFVYQISSDRFLEPSIYKVSTDGSSITSAATFGDIGPTYGLAYRSLDDDLFTSVFYKRHTRLFNNLGQITLGTIFRINHINTLPTISKFIDLNTIYGYAVAGSDNHDYGNMVSDQLLISETFKRGIGGITISSDQKYMYIVNLFNSSIYRISLGSGLVKDYSSYNTSSCTCDCKTKNTIEIFNILSLSGIMSMRPPGSPIIKDIRNIRPFGLKWYNNKLYFGLTNTEEFKVDGNPLLNTTEALNARPNLHAYVYSFDGFNPSSIQLELNFSLDYTRGPVRSGGTTFANGLWMPWTGDSPLIIPPQTIGLSTYIDYPQPILSDIGFITNGGIETMILGFRDRTSDQFTPSILPLATTFVDSAGDTLRAVYNSGSGTWVIENIYTVGDNRYFTPAQATGGVSGVLNDQLSQGAIAINTLTNRVAVSSATPINQLTGGIIEYTIANPGDAVRTNNIEIYNGSYPNKYGNANGLGSLEIINSLNITNILKYAIRLFTPDIVYNSALDTYTVTAVLNIIATNGSQSILNTQSYGVDFIDIDCITTYNVASNIPINTQGVFTIDFNRLSKLCFYITSNPCCKLCVPVTDFLLVATGNNNNIV